MKLPPTTADRLWQLLTLGVAAWTLFYFFKTDWKLGVTFGFTVVFASLLRIEDLLQK